MTNILVVTTVEHPERLLRDRISNADAVKVVVPVVKQGLLDWLANDQKAFGDAQETADRAADRLPSESVEPVAGEADVELAIHDALATFPADEIIVLVRPEGDEGIVESMATADAPVRSVHGVPVQTIIAGS
jgi:hypothetical protein